MCVRVHTRVSGHVSTRISSCWVGVRSGVVAHTWVLAPRSQLTHLGGDPAPALPGHPGPVGGPVPSRLWLPPGPRCPLPSSKSPKQATAHLANPAPRRSSPRPQPRSPSGRHASPCVRREGASLSSSGCRTPARLLEREPGPPSWAATRSRKGELIPLQPPGTPEPSYCPGGPQTLQSIPTHPAPPSLDQGACVRRKCSPGTLGLLTPREQGGPEDHMNSRAVSVFPAVPRARICVKHTTCLIHDHQHTQ